METESFGKRVAAAYEFLRSIVINGPEPVQVENPVFYDILVKNELTSKTTSDPVLLQYAVIYSHCEWEYYFNVDMTGAGDCIGTICRELAQEGISIFEISDHEMNLLRNEIIYGDQTYPMLLDDLRGISEAFETENSYRLLRELVMVNLQLRRSADVRKAISSMQAMRDTEPLADLDTAMFTASMYEWLDEDDCDSEEMRKVIVLLSEEEMSNSVLNLYNPITYKKTLARMIMQYLNKCEADFRDGEGDGNTLTDAFRRISAGDSSIAFSDDFIASVSDDMLDLMKEHDDLLLELVSYIPNDNDLAPIFKSTETMLWFKHLNLTFPGKLDYFLTGDIPRGRFWSCADFSPRTLCERLIAEFPNEAERILECFEQK